MTKIAVASSNGRDIDEHFGNAKQFYIFRVGPDGETEAYGPRAVPAERADGQDRLEAAADLLSDTDYVLAARIGRRAVEVLAARGCKGYALPGEIERALSNYGKRQHLLKNFPADLDLGVSDCGTCASSCGSSPSCGGRG